ncbi:MAG: glycosyltransferase family 2 protein [Thermoanaerobaculia bacterium]
MTPRVSVLIPTFNRATMIGDAIASVLADDFDDLEIVIVDDGSTDNTARVLDEWSQRDARIIVVRSPENRGIPAALNLGLANARGTYIARLDSDDLMGRGRLRAQTELLDARSDVVLATSAYEIVDGSGQHIATWQSDLPHELIVFLLHFYNIVGGGGQVMFRREEVLALGGYDVRYPSSEDYDLWVRLLRTGRIESVPFIGMTKREHGDQSNTRYASVKRANWTAIMRSSLEPYLQRAVTSEAIDALITLWRHDGKRGTSAIAHRVMREAFSRFEREHHDRALQSRLKQRIAQQWREAAQHFDGFEALKYKLRALQW